VNFESVRIETHVPRPWLERLRTIAGERGKTLEEITREAIAAYLGISPVEMEITDLKFQIGELTKLSSQIASLNLRLSLLEGRSLAPNPPAVSESDEEEEFDEPDEILQDFLRD
jgi:hypothetical protein